MAAKKAAQKTVDPADIENAFAKAVYDGDIVNFRVLFAFFSPAREDSTEAFNMPKYAYLLPDDDATEDPAFKTCLELVRRPEIRAHIEKELKANRQAQMPSELMLALADQAVVNGKYNSAAQAYEMLRVRARMQSLFYEQADAALDAGDITKAVRGYLIAAGLAYNYAAFPEPLPSTPDFQTRALLLHGDYPQTPEDCIGFADPAVVVQTALSYLLIEPEAAGRLENRTMEVKLAFLKELVLQRDSRWNEFIAQCRNAADLAREFGARLERKMGETGLAQEIEDQQGDDPGKIPAALLGRAIENGEWWQYLKELAYEHPAAALFVVRQTVGDTEILLPRYRADSPVAKALGLGSAA